MALFWHTKALFRGISDQRLSAWHAFKTVSTEHNFYIFMQHSCMLTRWTHFEQLSCFSMFKGAIMSTIVAKMPKLVLSWPFFKSAGFLSAILGRKYFQNVTILTHSCHLRLWSDIDISIGVILTVGVGVVGGGVGSGVFGGGGGLTCVTNIGIPILKIRLSHDRFTFIMEITIPGKTVFIYYDGAQKSYFVWPIDWRLTALSPQVV